MQIMSRLTGHFLDSMDMEGMPLEISKVYQKTLVGNIGCH